MKLKPIYIAGAIVVILGILILFFFREKEKEKEKEGLANYATSFCKQYEGKSNELEKACGSMTTRNCKESPCCVWVNNQKCVAGSQNGPTYRSDSEGNKTAISQYIFQNVCYGTGCPTTK